jgi:hypothetical protein
MAPAAAGLLRDSAWHEATFCQSDWHKVAFCQSA